MVMIFPDVKVIIGDTMPRAKLCRTADVFLLD